MFREGELTVRLRVDADRVRSVAIESTRVSLPERLTNGRPVPDVLRTMPLLFSICARAQGAAAAGALDAAQGYTTCSAIAAGRRAAVRCETIVELMTRMLIDWPHALGATADVESIAHLRQMPAHATLETGRAVAAERVYGTDPTTWLAEASPENFEHWTATAGTLPARLLRKLRTDALDLGRSDVAALPAAVEGICAILPALDDLAFGRAPHWSGRPVETGALARRAEHPLIASLLAREGNTVPTRFAAQLIDLACWLSDEIAECIPSVRQLRDEPGVGYGFAETARGLLLHQAEVSAGHVQRYRIIAPTEWNFHPAGALARGLVDRPVTSSAAAKRAAGLLVQALDPCVACTVEVENA